MYNSYNEKVFYKDEQVKVTNLRITCHHITVAIDKIDAVKVDFKIGTMTAAFTVFVLFLILIPALCCFFDCPFGWFGIIVLPVIFIWLRMVYKTYTELKVATGNGKVKLLETSMNRAEYLFKIERALVMALVEKSEVGSEQ
jgi:hypothetical protein